MNRPDEDTRVRRATRREWLGLTLLVLPMLMLSTDLTVLFFAMPSISADLDPTATQALWIVHVYGFLIAGFLITMGRLGDRVGPRRLLLIGSVAFALLSAAAALAPDASTLIAARALMGIAGATLMPSLFSLLRLMFDDERQRRLAIATMISAFSVGGAVGPLIGGALLESFWWGSVFLINLPPMALLVLTGPFLLPDRRGTGRIRLDVPSIALSVTGVLAVVYGVQELAAGHSGNVALDLAAVAVGLLILAVFVRRQRRLPEPLFDLKLLANRPTATALALLIACGIGVSGLFYLFTQYTQWSAGLSPLAAGLWTLPFIAVNIAGSMLAPVLTRRLRPSTVVAGGLAVAAIGAAAVAVVTSAGAPLAVIIGALSITGFGFGAAVVFISDLIISTAPAEQAGSAAAAQEVGGELGTAMGIAVGGAVSVVVYRTVLENAIPPATPPEAADAALDSVHDGAAAADTAEPWGLALLEAVRDAVGSGFQLYAVVATVVLAVAAGLGMMGLRARKG
ncbi:MFS transporter [Phytomonospora endophytica]|uniref:DHA2 family multidrug resistance protein-like MFS transporter n=1 Tax=Phytomonospora endophytica TaxID=714109 RepID=A0A841FJP6_9ACTN|nr:MFS transporter [Phytomonospora endophytica]MBB6036406.1 DHA2 family multidrug resistance protein-like MFS transporter [Phytomonospora endophytica]GIG65728.1 MFS transporter [Phytomonospora endophytica]